MAKKNAATKTVSSPKTAKTAKKAAEPTTKQAAEATRKVTKWMDVLSILAKLGGKQVNVHKLIAACEEQGIGANAVLSHVYKMRTWDEAYVTSMKHEGKGNQNEELAITAAGRKALVQG